MNFKPHHTAFTVKNTEESIKWYEDKLRFEVTHRYNKHGMEITQLKLDDVRIELFNYGSETRPLPQYCKSLKEDLLVVGTKHLCIETDNLDKTTEELKSKGVEFTQDIDTAGFGGRYIFFKDCNGILIELYESPK